MSRFRTVSVALVALGLVVGVAACGNDDNSADTTTTAKETTTTSAETAAEIRFDKTIQQELADVGCYKGEVDGVIGPETDAAVLEFQRYAGITADGELGPQTEKALSEAVDKGEKVCDANTTTTTSVTTTTTSPDGPPCTATALLEGIGGDPSTRITTYVCSDGYAAGTLGDGTTKFILVATGNSWERPSQDPCGSASAGIPPVILEDGCPS